MVNGHLATYLNDHLAGSTGALELLEHLEDAHHGDGLASFFSDLHAEITEDRNTLKALMARLNVTESEPRKLGAWLAEKAGWVKLGLEDRAGGDLHRLEALEALAIGIDGKWNLWRALAAAVDVVPELSGPNYALLEQRAEEQRERVEDLRIRSALAAFKEQK